MMAQLNVNQDLKLNYGTHSNPDTKHANPAGSHSFRYSPRLSEAQLQTLLPNATPCFDGSLICAEQDNMPLLVYVVKNMPEACRSDSVRFYGNCSHMQGFIGYRSCYLAGIYSCFEFDLYQGEHNLRDLYSQDNLPDAKSVFQDLVKFMSNYDLALFSQHQPYKPLCCFSPETVFFSQDGGLRILPLKTFRNNYPPEVPREASFSQATERTDLFSAAYLYVELSSNFWKNPDYDLSNESSSIQKLLSPFPSFRPTLETLIQKGYDQPSQELHTNGRQKHKKRYPHYIKNKTKVSFHPFSKASLRSLFSGMFKLEEQESQEQKDHTFNPSEDSPLYREQERRNEWDSASSE